MGAKPMRSARHEQREAAEGERVQELIGGDVADFGQGPDMYQSAVEDGTRVQCGGQHVSCECERSRGKLVAVRRHEGFSTWVGLACHSCRRRAPTAPLAALFSDFLTDPDATRPERS